MRHKTMDNKVARPAIEQSLDASIDFLKYKEAKDLYKIAHILDAEARFKDILSLLA